jgi:hypothetical protein
VPRRLLQAEGAVLFGVAVALYVDADFSLLAFVLLALAPDAAFLGFLVSPRIGAISYDALHFEGLPLLLGTIGVLAEEPVAIQVALIWLAHIGLDRMLGYGLRYPEMAQQSHLDRV